MSTRKLDDLRKASNKLSAVRSRPRSLATWVQAAPAGQALGQSLPSLAFCIAPYGDRGLTAALVFSEAWLVEPVK